MVSERSFRLKGAESTFGRLGEADLPAILDIERGGYGYPWSEAQFLDCMGEGFEAWGSFFGGRLTGYLVHWQVLDEAHLMNLCVDRSHTRQGIGRQLLRHWISRMTCQNMGELILEVRESNLGAQALYRSEGFVQVGERPDYYPDGGKRESAIIMMLRL
ncbi:[SSU ribosomal protein S18P]-alanine acetyltransferase [Halospina denitrificans]|uniref:[SSU ribosomal protein S18P]-alanine acetyltransferase n=1 Tax=Halospina denitrificans TaxID=332522 RepID=A0A4R7JJ27_9GAMM|nr:ribosomal protein S18-alanine N-acetyltransferase [Halospina denitrificans]TDT37902.1 [SSU ribosomal protein S18P]-alanine acetyltransferase [Halospina denitrificans]